MKYQILFILLALLSLSAPLGASVIYVSGAQTGIWSADTVIVTAEVRVPPGETLVINPGVEVYFQTNCKFIVDNGAALSAVGTLSDSILFDEHWSLPGNGWKGIRFLSASSSSQLQYCHLTNGFASGSGEDAKGGAIYCSSSSPTIQYCLINACSANSDGGGIYCSSSNPSIVSNAISENAADYGGGISCSDNSSPNISGNAISANWGYIGVGIRCEYSSPSISGNTISENSTAFGSAAGIYCYFSSPTIIGNTISGNSGWPGGGIYCGFNSSPTLLNCVLWENGPQQIYVSGGSPQVNYSDIQGGYTGTGNINADPLFINYAQHDYRLQWGSPCIDSGDPNPIYNDPDGTRADMGAWYYDQTMPVRILLTPYNAPIQIPPEGGSFQYAIQVTNISSTTFPILVWCNITLPSGMTFGPVLGPVRISLVSGQTISRVRTQNISGHAPAGLYHYNAFAVAAGDTSSDSFTFTKLGAGGWDLGAGGWTNAGESFDFTDVGARRASPLQHASRSGTTPTMEVMPNPFNPITVASFELRVSSYISLRIYDTAGRLVKTLVDGWREVGAHEVTFDGSQLPSGIYFADLTAGDYSQVQKLILLK